MLMNVNILTTSGTSDSKVVNYLIPFGHFIIDTVGKLFPVVKDFFIQLKRQFQYLAK
jgi:hypothetical protein